MNSTLYPKDKTEFILISALKTTFIFNVNDFKTNIFIVNCIVRLYVALYLEKRLRQVYSISVTKFLFHNKSYKECRWVFFINNNNNTYISRIRDVKNLKYMYTRIIFVYRGPSQELLQNMWTNWKNNESFDCLCQTFIHMRSCSSLVHKSIGYSFWAMRWSTTTREHSIT